MGDLSQFFLAAVDQSRFDEGFLEFKRQEIFQITGN